MNSTVCVTGYFVFVLTINLAHGTDKHQLATWHAVPATNNLAQGHENAYDDTQQEVKLRYPFYFGYYSGQKLNMTVTLKNIASNVYPYLTHEPSDIFVKPVRISESGREQSFLYYGVLTKINFWIQVELYTESGLCKEITITYADIIFKNRKNTHKWKYNDSCLALKLYTIEVDLNNECNEMPNTTELIPLETKCYRELKKFVCTAYTNIANSEILMWYYDHEVSVRRFIPPLQARSTKLIMSLEKFDNYTEIYYALAYNTKILLVEGTKIKLLANESDEYSGVTTLKYGLKNEVFFSCWNYLNVTEYIQLGFINTANKISTSDRKRIKTKFNMADNGTILCCLLHIIDDDGTEERVERLVKNKTILIYDESLDVPSGMPILKEMKCYRELKQFICTFHTNLVGNITQMWYHSYENSVIGFIPPLNASNTKLIINLETFDNNTEIYYTLYEYNANKRIPSAERTKIYLFANEFGEYSDVTTLKYGLKNEVFFNCGNYLHVTKYIQLGFINTANKISTSDRKWIKKKFNMADNGTILCCLLYIIDDDGTEKRVERFVKNKTILIYDESLDFSPTEMSDPSSMFKYIVLYITSTISTAVVILCVIILIYIIKCCHKNPEPEEPLELNTYDSTNRVLYADLDLGRGVQTTKRDEECTYAEIIGTLHPF